MKLFYKSWGLVGALLCLGLASSAFGQTATLEFTGGTGSSYGGEDTSPYGFSVNGSAADSFQLICDSFVNHISSGESWTATLNNIGNVSTVGQYAPQTYDEVGNLAIALFESQTPVTIPTAVTTETNPPTEQELLSWAIWTAFDSTADSGLSTADQSYIASLDNWATTAAATYSVGGIGLGNLVFYTPVAGSQTGTLGTPQEFIGLNTPEPSSAAVLGLDLLAFGGVVLFFRRRASRVA